MTTILKLFLDTHGDVYRDYDKDRQIICRNTVDMFVKGGSDVILTFSNEPFEGSLECEACHINSTWIKCYSLYKDEDYRAVMRDLQDLISPYLFERTVTLYFSIVKA